MLTRRKVKNSTTSPTPTRSTAEARSEKRPPHIRRTTALMRDDRRMCGGRDQRAERRPSRLRADARRMGGGCLSDFVSSFSFLPLAVSQRSAF